MLQPTVYVDHHLTISIKRGTTKLSLDEARSEELPRTARQDIPAFRVYQKGPC